MLPVSLTIAIGPEVVAKKSERWGPRRGKCIQISPASEDRRENMILIAFDVIQS
jgi:hypothetical protein